MQLPNRTSEGETLQTVNFQTQKSVERLRRMDCHAMDATPPKASSSSSSSSSSSNSSGNSSSNNNNSSSSTAVVLSKIGVVVVVSCGNDES